MIMAGILELKISVFDKRGDLLKLFVGIFAVVEQDAVEDLGQVSEKVRRRVTSNVRGLLQLVPNTGQCVLVNAHLSVDLRLIY